MNSQMTTRAFVGSVVLSLATATAVLAQGTDTTATMPKMPAWDVAFTLGLLETNGGAYASDKLETRVDLGRYWTNHLKTEVGVSLPTHSENYYDYYSFPVPGLTRGGFAANHVSERLTIVAPTLTYQFFENAFVHPYVSTGFRLMLWQSRLVREAQTHTESGISYAVPPLDRTTSTVKAYPHLAGGFKTYFNEKTFIRTEALIAIGSNGATHTALRMGVGFDF